MTLNFLGNCGVAIFDGDVGVMIDAPNGLHTSFDAVPEKVTQEVAASVRPYDKLRALLFTHRHSDHYDHKLLSVIHKSRPDLAVLDVNGATPPSGEMELPELSVRYETIAHSGEEFRDVFHRVFLIRLPSGTVYITGDADWKSPLHRQLLLQEKPLAAIWNPNFVSHEDGRSLLPLCPKNFICHMRVNVPDTQGIGAKCRRMFSRYADELAAVTLIEHYPTSVEI